MAIVGSVVETIVGVSNLSYLFILPFWLPLLSAGVRRLHDVGKSGWFYLVPIYNIVLLASASTADNQYGARQ
jgi:uncharacterized membrane protein YhaH (DUF805 family)